MDKNIKKNLGLLFLMIAFSISGNAQVKLGNNPSSMSKSAILEMESTDKGILFPRLSTLQRNAIISPVQGLVIYNTTVDSIQYRGISSWVNVDNISPWGLRGNSGTTSTSNFIGTKDDVDVIIRRASRLAQRLSFWNVALGDSAMGISTIGVGRIAIGNNAQKNSIYGNDNISIGRNSMTDANEGWGNIALGFNSLEKNTGITNVAIGQQTLALNTNGYHNTGIGGYVLPQNTTGHGNVAVGRSSMAVNEVGSENTVLGFSSMTANTSGNYNTVVGSRSYNTLNTDHYNTAIGVESMTNYSSGSKNTALGYRALYSGSGGKNTAIGDSAMVAPSANNAIAIGANAYAGASNTLVLGGINGINGATSNTNVGIGTSTPQAELHVAGTGAIIVPVGTTAQRPNIAVEGMIRFNTTINKFEGYDGTNWISLN